MGALLAQINDTPKQAAIEEGQRNEKREPQGSLNINSLKSRINAAGSAGRKRRQREDPRLAALAALGTSRRPASAWRRHAPPDPDGTARPRDPSDEPVEASRGSDANRVSGCNGHGEAVKPRALAEKPRRVSA
jgi:hypothetical protein